MPVTFAWRSDTTTAFANGGECAYRGLAGTTMTAFGLAVQNSLIGITAEASAIGGLELDCSNINQKQINFTGAGNFGSTGKISMLLRYRGVTPTTGHLVNIGGPRFVNTIGIFTDTAGNIRANLTKENAVAIINNLTMTSATTKNTSTASYTDFVFTFDMQTITGTLKSYFNSSLTTSLDASLRFITSTSSHSSYLAKGLDPICLFQGGFQANWRGYLNEIVIWDELIDPTSVNLIDPSTGVTSTGALNGASRTGWVDCAKFNGAKWESLTAAQIQNGVTQIQAGYTQTGTFGGTYTDPGTTNVRLNTTYIFNDVTQTGSLSVPTPATGSAGTVDLNNLLEQIQYVLEQANTTTASPVDLSSGMTRRVQVIDKINPNLVRPQASLFPYVTCFVTGKTMRPETIAKNQATARRSAIVSMDIVGMVWNPIMVSSDSDPADNDIHLLMENIELTLRSYDNLNSNCRYQIAESVDYYDEALDESAHLRAGIMGLKITVDY